MSEVLLDTSVWVSYFRQQAEEELLSAVREALLEGRVHTCWPVKAELLVGARDPSGFERLRGLLGSLIQIPMQASLWQTASQLGFALRRLGARCRYPTS